MEYEVVDQSIVELMTGQAIQDYVYSFKQGGKVVEGLTIAGINEAANRRGGIQVKEIDYKETDEQPKKIGDRPDPFAFTKAIYKAQRNAIKQLIPVPVIREVLNFYLHRKVKLMMPSRNRRRNKR